MKKAIFLAAFSAIAVGSIVSSCESKSEKVEEAKEDVREAKEDLKEAQRELNAEYPAFKTAEDERITANEKRIAELKEKLNKPGKAPLDNMRAKRIAELEEKNAQLRSRLYGYEQERTDWEQFKQEWNHDMEGFDQAFKDLGKDNK
jgi:chromosome segregation ATPase